MPYSELHRMAKGTLDSAQTKMINTPIDPTSVPDDDFVELVWENGQIMMQSQANRTRKSTSGTGFSSITTKTQEKEREDTGNPKSGRFGTIDSVYNDFSCPGPSGQIGLGHDDEMVPWLNYPFDDNLPQDYCSEFMNDLTGANMNTLSAHNNAVPIGKDTSYGQIARDSHTGSSQGGAKLEQRNVSKGIGGVPDPSRLGSGWLCSSTFHQNQSSVPSFRSSVSDFARSNTNNTHQTACENSSMTPALIGRRPNTIVPKQDPAPRKPTGQLNNNMGLMNFSHFSRPAGLSRPSLQNVDVPADPDRLRSSEKMSSVVNSNPIESTVIDSTSGSPSVVEFKIQPVVVLGKKDLRPVGKPPKEPVSTEHSEAMCGENVYRSTRMTDQSLGTSSSFAASAAAGKPESEKDVEPVVGSSSMCSGSSAGGTSNEPKDILKRKSRDAEESEYQSEDIEEESVGVRKSTTNRGGTGAKRSRAAEVHNLSERRRRDRINEKMRALQELIPNCNKVDKASMLDEAIEYLKTLQLQVQIMSMGPGMYMPPMMLPTGMHAPHFSPMGVGMGMGMGMGFGMGMLDMSGGRPLMMPHMHGMQFPRSPMSGSTSLPMMAGPGLQMLGIPGQGPPMSMPRAPYTPLTEGLSTRSVSVPDMSGTASFLEGPNSVIPSTSKGIMQNTNLQMMTKTSGECSQDQTLTQSQAAKDDFEQSPIVQRNDQAPTVSGN